MDTHVRMAEVLMNETWDGNVPLTCGRVDLGGGASAGPQKDTHRDPAQGDRAAHEIKLGKRRPAVEVDVCAEAKGINLLLNPQPQLSHQGEESWLGKTEQGR